MSDVKAIAQLMRELEEQLVVCMRCGMCQSVCPVFSQTGREADVARGKLALLDGLMQELFQDPDGVSQRLERCLLCGRCAANCPSGVKVLDLFLKARAILTAFHGLSPGKRLVLRPGEAGGGEDPVPEALTHQVLRRAPEDLVILRQPDLARAGLIEPVASGEHDLLDLGSPGR